MRYILILSVLLSSISFAYSSEYMQERMDRFIDSYFRQKQKIDDRLIRQFNDIIEYYEKRNEVEEVERYQGMLDKFINNTIDSMDIDSNPIDINPLVLKRKITGMKFYWGIENVKVISSNFILDIDGKISGYSHPNENTWEINDNNQLIVYNIAGKKQWVFDYTIVEGIILFKGIRTNSVEGIYLKEAR